MKTIRITKIVKFVLLVLCVSVQAQEADEATKKKFEFSGSVDAYYRGNLSDEQNQTPPTAFANRPGFALGMINLIGSYSGEKVGFVADLVFGPRGDEATFNSPFIINGSSNIVNQLYVYLKASESLKFTLGNFNTYLGYEVISPVGNFNYSTSYLFSYGPFSHTGLKADIAFDEKWSLMLAVMNGTDLTEFNPTGLYTYGAQIGYANETGSAYLNFLYGKQTLGAENTFQVDLTTGWDLNNDFYLGFNASYNETDETGFYGAAIYPQLKTSDSFSLGLRAEYFKELEDGGAVVFGPDTDILGLTLTGSYEVEGLILKPEVRLDSVSEDVFVDKDGNPQGSLASFVLGAVYAF